MPSMHSPNSSIRVRSSRPHLKSISTNRTHTGSDCKYIEHLEGALSAVQNERPSPAHDKAVKMSRINAENRQLQAQLKDWEVRYDEEVRDFVQRQNEVERALRSKNTTLEDYATKAKDRVVELELQLQQTQHALQAAESANVQLEKRVEIMSDLLTSVPPRPESHTDMPGRKRMHTRPRSMLPRLSTTGSWVSSLDRNQDAGVLSSPSLSFTHIRENTIDSFEPLAPIVSREVSAFSPRQSASNIGYESDERPFSATSTTFSDNARHSIDAVTSSRSSRPMRRMRRFGAGSGTKSLILPFASQYELPASAPPLEHYEAFPSFPLERFISNDSNEGASPVRSRQNTMSHDATLACLVGSPDQKETGETERNFRRMLSLARQSSDNRPHSIMSTGSDFGGLVSRNLLEELNAVKMTEKEKKTVELAYTGSGAERAVDSAVEIADTDELSDSDELDMLPSIQHEDFRSLLMSSPMTRKSSSPATPLFVTESLEMDVFNPALEGIMGPFMNSSPASEPTPRAHIPVFRSRTPSAASHRCTTNALSLSTLARLRSIFGDLLHHPVDVARLIIHVTQQRMHVPGPLLSVQWWLVSILWGPMARRRLLDQARQSGELSLLSDLTSPVSSALRSTGSPSLAVSESLAYGTLYKSPVSRSGIRRRTGMAGHGRKRTTGTQEHGDKGESLLAKHNPLLWMKFSLTLAYAIGTAFASGPGALMQGDKCPCKTCKGLNK